MRRFQDFIIKYTPITLYFIMVGAVVCALFFNNYLDIFKHIADAGSVSVIVSVHLIATTYRTKLCTYNKIATWSFLGFNIINKVCEISLSPQDFNLYINIYIPALLIPTTIAVMYYLIKSYDPK